MNEVECLNFATVPDNVETWTTNSGGHGLFLLQTTKVSSIARFIKTMPLSGDHSFSSAHPSPIYVLLSVHTQVSSVLS